MARLVLDHLTCYLENIHSRTHPLFECITHTGVVQFQKMLMEAGVKDLKFEHYDIDFTADGEMGNFWSVVTFLDANNDVIDTVK